MFSFALLFVGIVSLNSIIILFNDIMLIFFNIFFLQNTCVTAIKFIGHLVNQQVLHELVALEALTLLLEDPTDDSVEVAVGFLKV